MSVRVFADSERVRQLDLWIDRLDAFIPALGAIDADDPSTFCQDAWDIWESATAADPPSESNPAMLLVLGVFGALTELKKSISRRIHSTPEQGNRWTVAAAHSTLSADLNTVADECRGWRLKSLPAAADVAAISATAMAGLHVARASANRLSA